MALMPKPYPVSIPENWQTLVMLSLPLVSEDEGLELRPALSTLHS